MPKTKKTIIKKPLKLAASLNFRNPAMLAAITVVALTGIYLVVRLLAAQITAFEAEGARTGSVALINDSAASGGQYIQFGGVSGTNPPPPVTPPPPPPVTPPPPPPVLPPPPPPPPPPPGGGASGVRCMISLHGKGGSGGGTYAVGNVTEMHPGGNADAQAEGGSWGDRQWHYATNGDYNSAMSNINAVLNATTCGQIVLQGHSNGASMASKIYCKGETFSGRLVGAILDDPVPDQAIDSCTPGTNHLALIQSDEMNGWIGGGGFCPDTWTCQGVTHSLSSYASILGVTPSHKSGHSDYVDYYGINNSWWN